MSVIHVILLPINQADRGELEFIEGSTFDCAKQMKETFTKRGIDAQIMPLNDFMTLWNDTDSDVEDENNLDIAKFWLGYVRIADGFCSGATY